MDAQITNARARSEQVALTWPVPFSGPPTIIGRCVRPLANHQLPVRRFGGMEFVHPEGVVGINALKAGFGLSAFGVVRRNAELLHVWGQRGTLSSGRSATDCLLDRLIIHRLNCLNLQA